MTDNKIKLNKDNILRLEIETSDGKSTGNFLEFNLEDIEIPLRYQELLEKDKKNKQDLRNQMLIIDKRQDVNSKNKLLTRNEEDKIKALNDFFKKEIEVYNMFLGENGFEKLLNGRKVGWTVFQEIDEIIEKQIAPHLNYNMESITEKVKQKYNQAIERNNKVLKDE